MVLTFLSTYLSIYLFIHIHVFINIFYSCASFSYALKYFCNVKMVFIYICYKGGDDVTPTWVTFGIPVSLHCHANLGHLWHTSISTQLKCMQNLIKISCAVQDLWSFLLKDNYKPKWCLANPHHQFANQWLDNVKINKYVNFDPNTPHGSRVMSIFTKLSTTG